MAATLLLPVYCVSVLLAISVLCQDISAEADDTAGLPVGFKVRITQKGLDYTRDVATQIMMREMGKLTIPDQQESMSPFNVEINNIHVTHFTEPTSELTPIPGIGLRWSAKHLAPTIQAEYIAIMKIGFFKIKKQGTLKISGRFMSFTLDFIIGRTPDGKPDISVHDCSADGQVSLYFNGGWSEGLNVGSRFLRTRIRELVLAQICANARKELEENMATAMQHIMVTETIENDFELDYRLVRYPNFYTEGMETFHKGSISLIQNGKAVQSQLAVPEIPYYPEHTEKMVYIYVTDNLFNSGLHAAFSSGKLQKNISSEDLPAEASGYLDTSCSLSLCLGTIFPTLEETYPDGQASLRVYATGAPQTGFKNGLAIVQAAANAEVYINNGNEPNHIFTIHVNITADFEVTLTGQKLTFIIMDIKPYATISVNNLLDTGLEFFFDTLVRLATQQYLVPMLTDLGEKGLDLPDLPDVTFVNPEVIIDEDVPDVLILASDVLYEGDILGQMDAFLEED